MFVKLRHTCIIIILIILYGSNRIFGQESPFPKIPGWKCTQDSIVYNTNNLWDIIDGAADLFLEYNFVDLYIAQYSQSDSLEVKVELYRHKSPADAFGIYSQERDTSYDFFPVGVQGYLEKGVLNFFAGIYYTKISSNQSGEKVQDALVTIAKAVEMRLRQPTSWPKPLHLLPTQGKLINTEQYIAKNFLGYGFFHSAFVATYKDSIPFKMFIIELRTSSQVKEILDEYGRNLPKNTIKSDSEGRYSVIDPHHGLIKFLVKNNYLVGVINCSNEKMQERYLKELEKTLP